VCVCGGLLTGGGSSSVGPGDPGICQPL
jgi:hypothetical protein